MAPLQHFHGTRRTVADVGSESGSLPAHQHGPDWQAPKPVSEQGGSSAFACPNCFQRMVLRAVVLPPATLKVLDGLEAASRAPPRPVRVAS